VGKDKEPTKAKSTEAASDKESKTLTTLKTAYAKNPNKVLRIVNFHYAKKLLGNMEMKWEDYCDVKIKAFAEFWTAKKKNRHFGKTPKVLSADQLKKKKEAMEKAIQRAKAYEEAIKASEALAAAEKK
jgi:hypothetical protein